MGDTVYLILIVEDFVSSCGFFHTFTQMQNTTASHFEKISILQAAKVFSWVSMGLIVLSVGTFIAETMPEYREDLKKVGTFFIMLTK